MSAALMAPPSHDAGMARPPVRLARPAFFLPGQRIALRRLDIGDANALFALYSDAEVMRYWNHGPWTSISQARTAIDEARADYLTGASLHYAIVHRETGELIGSCALYAISRTHACASVGYLLAKKLWGRGLMREAMRLLLDHAFHECGLNRVEAEVSMQNRGSCMALARLGFQREGWMRERWIVDGQKHDTVAYGLLRGDWGLRQSEPINFAPHAVVSLA